jgi:hypothetical protein
MAGVDERIVREYFEVNGFLVRQMRKYQVQSRAKRTEEEIDLLVFNPTWKASRLKPSFLLFSNELERIQRAVVFVKPWHSQRFTPGTLRGSADISKFLEKDILKHANELFNVPDGEVERLGSGPVLRILVLPGLPTHEPHKSHSIKLLQDVGMDAVISFRAILQDLVGKIEVNHNYSKSDLMQLMRLLKHYDMLKSPQMELFQTAKKG